MAKRFTDTLIWEKEWFMKLSPKHKCLFKFIVDRCDPSGVWEQNWTLASIYIGEKCDYSDTLVLASHLEKLPNGKILVTDFISFQYGKLSEKCAAHIPIFKAIEKNKLSLDRVSNRVFYTLKEKETEKEEDKEEEKEKRPEIEKQSFELNWQRAFDDIYCDQLQTKYRGLDLSKELSDFRFKCDSAPTEYHCRDRDGLRLGFLSHLKKPNGKSNGTIKNTPSAEIIPRRKDFGVG